MTGETGLVFGAGFLGTIIGEKLGYKVLAHNEIDATSQEQVRDAIRQHNPQVVVNAVGLTGGEGAIGVDFCETHKEDAVRLNVNVPVIIGTAAQDNQSYFVHLGSGCIYEGDNGGKGWNEEDAPNFVKNSYPFYSFTKQTAEQRLRMGEIPALIIRLRMPIHSKPHPRNLIDKLASYPRVIDIPNSMTSVDDMVEAIACLIEDRAKGVYNVTNPGITTAKEIMEMYQRIVDSSHKFEVMPVTELDSKTKARRSNCVLNSGKLHWHFQMPEIHEALVRDLIRYAEYK